MCHECLSSVADPESRSIFLGYFTNRYRNSSFITSGKEKKYIGYDNMCNLVRSLEKVKDKDIKLEELTEKVIKVVDKFHFKAHVGEFCRKHVNPNMWRELTDTNMSVAEQSFKVNGRLKRSFRYMNKETFGFMLQDVCCLQQLMRDLGFVSFATAQQEAEEAAEDSLMKQQALDFKAASAAASKSPITAEKSSRHV